MALRMVVRAGARVASRTAVVRAVPAVTRAAAVLATRFSSSSTDMFCFQCEQTEKGTGCTTVGVCGKTASVAGLQDTMIHVLKGIAQVTTAARAAGVPDSAAANRFTLEAMFATLTNVNFDDARFVKYITQGLAIRNERAAAYKAKTGKEYVASGAAAFNPTAPCDLTAVSLETFGKTVGVKARQAALGEEVVGLQELITYGLKGTCAYAMHAYESGKEDAGVYKDIQDSLAFIAGPCTVDALVGEALKVGATNVNVLALLSNAHMSAYGTPTPVAVNHSPTKGKAILVSGHDFADLLELLKQTEGKGINVYTHGEMLPAHGYPGLKGKYPHLVGNYGGAWQLQKFDFAKFPGPVVITTNCLMKPQPSYEGRLFTMNAVGWPGIKHLKSRDFSEVIAKAQTMEGFKETKPAKTELTGFGYGFVLSEPVVKDVLDAATSGKLKKIVLIGGCDGSESDRSYFTDLGVGLPDSAMILTMGCGKYRLIGKKNFGVIPGTTLPRLLDMGQCSDSFSAVMVAQALAKALKTDINSLPLSINLSWFEQKAVAVLLSLLHLGVKGISIGPVLPAFVTPKTLKLLVDTFALEPIDPTGASKKIARIMGK